MAFDGAGNTLDDAKKFDITSTTQIFTDWVGSTDGNDYYRFTLGSTSSVNLTLDGLSDDADVQLLDSSGEVIVSPEEAATTAELINQTLVAGDYYIRVYPWKDAATNYNLNVSATSLDFAGNTLNDARQISLNGNGTAQTFTDWVGSTDTNDYYSFSLGSTSTLDITLDGLLDDADVQLLDSSGEVIVNPAKAGTTAELINQTLDAGNYYVRVLPWKNAVTSYNLTVSTTALDFSNNTLNDARQIALNGNGITQTFTDWVGSTDTNDYYSFSLGSTSDFNLNLDGLSDDADVQLLDNNGEVIVSPEKAGTTAESISQTLNAGDYYIRVLPWRDASTSYNLSVSATALDFAGNTLNDARQIALNGNGTIQTFTDWLGSTDSNDYYRFSVSSTSSFKLDLDELSDNAEVRLFKSNGDTVATSTTNGSIAELINRTLDAGDYYIQVYPSNNNVETSYNLNLSATAVDFAGNTLNDARQIALNGNGITQTFTDWVGSTDGNDYYRFSLSSDSTLNLNLDSLSDDADVQLLDSSGEVIVNPAKAGTTAELINQTLDAGDYYIRVLPWKDATTSYSLSVSATSLGQPEQPNTEPWIKQLGTEGDDFSNGIAVDGAGNVYVTGFTDGSLGGDNAGYYDTWLAKYDSGGNQSWKTQLGTEGDDISYSLDVDSSGNIYIAGEGGVGSENTNLADDNAWLAKYDSSGNLIWTKQVGAYFSSDVAVDNAGNTYITGGIADFQGSDDFVAWVAKYDSNGNQRWFRHLDAEGDDFSYGVAVDNSGNVYITGDTEGSLGKFNPEGNINAWLAKYNSSGTLQWTTQLGSDGDDYSYSVAVDNAGNVYITGDTENTNGILSETNAWLAKFDSSGTFRWWSTPLSTEDDFSYSSYSVAVDDTGNVYLTGDTDGAFGGIHAGGIDAWLAKYDSDGNQLSIKQIGTTGEDSSVDVAVDSVGNVYITGDTNDTLQGNSAGNIDAWVAKYTNFIPDDNLISTPGNDVLIGSSGNDTLVGGYGNDTLTGSTGTDIFVLNAPNQGVDLITDFSPTDDILHASINDFNGGLTADNTVSEDQILLGNGTVAANSATERFIYDTNTGALLFDADGNQSGFEAVQIATLSNAPTISADNIFITT